MREKPFCVTNEQAGSLNLYPFSLYLFISSIHLSISFNFILLKRKKMAYKTIYATDMGTNTQTKKEHNQFTHREREKKTPAKPLKNYFFTYHEFQHSVLHCTLYIVRTHLNHRPIKERGGREKK